MSIQGKLRVLIQNLNYDEKISVVFDQSKLVFTEIPSVF